MSQPRLRSTMPAADAPSDEAALAEWPQSTSLPELREAMSSPGVIQAEVDALLAAIARPPADDETPRARADFLLSLMNLPEEAGERKGSDGRTVRAAAVEALLDLGYPYALEVPPEVLEAVRLETGQGRGRERKTRVSAPGIVVTLLSLVVQLGLLVLVASHGPASTWERLQLICLGLIVLPPLMAVSGQLLDLRGMQSLGARGMTLQGLVWLFIAWLDSSPYSGYRPLVLVPWYLPLLAAYLMRARPAEAGDAPAATPASPVEPS